MINKMEKEIPETWILWYHSINDNQWGKGTYKKIHTISSLYDRGGSHSSPIRLNSSLAPLISSWQ